MKATLKRPKVFTLAEVADRQKELLAKTLGISPEGVNEDGYFYNGEESVKALRKWKVEKEKKK